MRPSTTACVAAKPLQFDLCCSTHCALLLARAAMDDLDASYEALTRAIEASRLSAPPPRCAPSRLLETAEPSPERLRAAAADTTLHRARAGSWAPPGRIAWQRCFPPAGALALAMVTAKANRSIRRASTGSSARGSARSALCGNSAPAASEGYRFSVLVRNEDEGVVEGCCVRVGNYELNDTFVLEPGEHVHSLEANAVTRIGHRDDDIRIALCGLHFGSTEGQFESFENPSPDLGEAEEQSYATDHCRPGEVIRTFYGRVKWVAPDRWSRMQGLHQAYRILCALGVVYGPGPTPPGAPRAPGALLRTPPRHAWTRSSPSPPRIAGP